MKCVYLTSRRVPDCHFPKELFALYHKYSLGYNEDLPALTLIVKAVNKQFLCAGNGNQLPRFMHHAEVVLIPLNFVLKTALSADKLVNCQLSKKPVEVVVMIHLLTVLKMAK